MQILANALPGFRDLRGPIIAGYLWLVFAWLLVLPDLHRRPGGELAGGLYDLGQFVGPLGIALSTSVAAYLVGALSQELASALRWALVRIFAGAVSVTQAVEPLEEIFARGVDTIEDALGDRRPQNDAQAQRIAARKERLTGELEQRNLRASSEIRRELAMPATLLVGEQPQLFAEVDRLRAEGELRLGVAPPLVALVVLAAVTESWIWLVALIGPLLLFVQGIRRNAESRKVIADAMFMQKVRSPGMAAFEEWVDKDLPTRANASTGGFDAAEHASG